MKKKIIIVILILLILSTLIIYCLFKNNKIEYFNNNHAIIDLKNINYYYLTIGNTQRINNITKQFKGYNLIQVLNNDLNGGKNVSGAKGFLKVMNTATKKGFKPFVMLEDDISLTNRIPDNLMIPKNADLIYIGLSNAGLKDLEEEEGKEWTDKVFYENIDKNIIKIYNMLSLHGIIIYSKKGLEAIRRCMKKGIENNKIWDIYTASIQPYLNVYALKYPIVYQDSKVGGQESQTKINSNHFNKEGNKKIPNEYLQKNILL